MALTELQRQICRLIAENRIASGESYVAGGTALGVLTGAARISRDIDLFHDTEEALDFSWRADRRLLERTAGCSGALSDLARDAGRRRRRDRSAAARPRRDVCAHRGRRALSFAGDRPPSPC